jgi:hypothetical protein
MVSRDHPDYWVTRTRLVQASSEHLESLRRHPHQFESVVRDSPHLDIGSAGHAIHFLLTGSASRIEGPLGFLLGGDLYELVEIGELIDLRIHAVMGFTTEHVQAIGVALAPITARHLYERYDPGAMVDADIRPENWDRDPSLVDQVLASYTALKRFVLGTIDVGACMIAYDEFRPIGALAEHEVP